MQNAQQFLNDFKIEITGAALQQDLIINPGYGTVLYYLLSERSETKKSPTLVFKVICL